MGVSSTLLDYFPIFPVVACIVLKTASEIMARTCARISTVNICKGSNSLYMSFSQQELRRSLFAAFQILWQKPVRGVTLPLSLFVQPLVIIPAASNPNCIAKGKGLVLQHISTLEFELTELVN